VVDENHNTPMRLWICRALLISTVGDSCQTGHNFPSKSGHCSHDGGTPPILAFPPESNASMVGLQAEKSYLVGQMGKMLKPPSQTDDHFPRRG
jgi:hypothetical protein